MCQHDATFEIENQANGGQGCPRCKRVVMVQHIGGKQEVAPDFGLTPDDIADMQARCEETAQADEYSSSTEGHW